MSLLSELYFPVSILGGLLPLLFLRPALRNRDKPGATGLLVCIPAAIVYAFAVGIRSLPLTATELFVVQNVVMLGGGLGAAGWFLLFAEYTGLVNSTRRALYAMTGFVVLMQLVIITNPFHHLFYDPIPQLTGDTSENRRLLYWLFVLTLYGAVVVSVVSILRDIVTSRGIRQRQAFYLFLGSVPPVVTVSTSGTASIVPVDITPLGFVAGTAILTWAMFRAEFLEIVSVGRSRVIENIEDPFVTIDEEGRVVDSNPTAREVFDVGDGWKGMEATTFFGAVGDWVEDIRTGDGSETELSIERTGEQYHFDVETTALSGPQDERRGQVLVFRDVTAIKNREEELAALTERYDLALDSTDTGVWEWNTETDAVEFDERMTALFGHSPDDDIDRYEEALEHVPAEDMENLSDAYRRGLADGAYETEFRVSPDDDTQRWLWVRAEAYHEDGDLHFVGIGQDITDRKRRERELERKNELLDEFASVVSHDVATPLGVIENKARLIELTDETAHASDIREASERVQKLVDELRHLAHQGEDVGEANPVDLEQVVTEAWDSVEAAGAELRVASSRVVHADQVRFRQLLENLLENAVEHGSRAPQSAEERDTGSSASPVAGTADDADHSTDSVPEVRGDGSTDSPGLSITVGALSDGFYVEDDGPGIPESDRDTVFKQGYSTADSGAGLGLAIVRRIADGHDWSITVTESDEGGARFEITTEN